MKKIVVLLALALIMALFCSCGAPESAEKETDSTDETKVYEDYQPSEDNSDTDVFTDSSEENTQEADKETPLITPKNFEPWSDYDDLDPQIRHVTTDTPGHAGINLREGLSSDSNLIMIIPEGAYVYWVDDVEESRTYIKISVKADGKTYTGYAMERYVTTFTGAAFDDMVSYDTPDHAGLVLRESDSKDSKAIMTVPEGTEVRIWEHDTDTKEYWWVDVFYNGEIIDGYLLGEYIVPKNIP